MRQSLKGPDYPAGAPKAATETNKTSEKNTAIESSAKSSFITTKSSPPKNRRRRGGNSTSDVIDSSDSSSCESESSVGPYDHRIRDPPPLPAYDLHRTDAIVIPSSSVDNLKQSKQFLMPSSSSPAGHQHLYHRSDNESSYEPSQVDSESYLEFHEAAAQMNNVNPHHYYSTTRGAGDDSSTILTANYASHQNMNNHANQAADATDIVHEMHLALLYLLSNPDEFQKALQATPEMGATTLAQWNAEYDNESLVTAETEYTGGQINNNKTMQTQSSTGISPKFSNDNTSTSATSQKNQSDKSPTPLPFVVFADDAEVVLPQAHTASQLFGIERLEGIELEAAAGIPALSQLFLRWLALMPGGDHLNIIDPPGLTVMRIAGGRYRVTAAHRVVWTWMNEFAQLTFSNSGITTKPSYQSNSSPPNSPLRGTSCTTVGKNNARRGEGGDAVDQLQIGDLVSMTIVDVFETDSNGKLLSYCPTFDNRAVMKTNATTEALRKSSSKVLAALNRAQKSKLALAVARHAATLATNLRKRVDKAVYGSSTSSQDGNSPIENRKRHDSRDGTTPDDDLPTNEPPLNQDPTLSFGETSSGIPTSAFQTTSKPTNTKHLDDPIITSGASIYLADDDLERHEI